MNFEFVIDVFDKIDNRFLRIIRSKNRGQIGGGRHEVRVERDVIV
jgi:hypothetical protein